MNDKLLGQAKEYADSGEYDKAIDLCDQIISESGSLREVFFLRSRCFAAMGKIEDAVADHRSGMTESDEENGYTIYSIALDAMASKLPYDYCDELFELSAKRFEEERADMGEKKFNAQNRYFFLAACYNKSGMCKYRMEAPLDEESACFEKAMNILEAQKELDNNDKSILSLIRCNLAECRIRQGRDGEAHKLYSAAAEDFRHLIAEGETSGAEQFAVCLHNLADTCNYDGENIRAMALISEAIDVLEAHRDKIDKSGLAHLSSLYNARGTMHFQTGDYKSEVADCTRSIEIAETEHLKDYSLSVTYSNRAEAYENLKLYDKAIADYLKSREILSEYSHIPAAREYYAICIFSLARTCEQSGDRERAISYYTESSECFEKLTDHTYQPEKHSAEQLIRMEALCRFRLGMCLCEGVERDYHACLTQHQRALDLLELCDEADTTDALMALHTSLGEIFEMFEDDRQAEYHFDQAEKYRLMDGLMNFFMEDDVLDGDSPKESGEEADELPDDVDDEDDIWSDAAGNTPTA